MLRKFMKQANAARSTLPPCPDDLKKIIGGELKSDGLRYMLAMYWQGRKDKISHGLVPALDWLTQNGLPSDIVADFQFKPGDVAFHDHSVLIERVMQFARDSVVH